MKFILFVLWTVAFFKVEGQSRPRSRDEMSIMEIVNATAQLSEVRTKIYVSLHFSKMQWKQIGHFESNSNKIGDSFFCVLIYCLQ